MKWTSKEDQILLRHCRAQQLERPDGIIKDWNAIANALPNRNNKDCRKRWYNVVSGVTRKGCWSPEEDERLINAVGLVGTSWAAVAEIIGNRSADQCAKRWQQNLNPELEHGKWTKRECDILVEAVKTTGRKWLQIRDEHFPKRATNNIKNQYHILTKDHVTGPDRRQSRNVSEDRHTDDGYYSSPSKPDLTSRPTYSSTNSSLNMDDGMLRLDPRLSPMTPQTDGSFDDLPSSMDFLSGASNVGNFGNALQGPWPDMEHIDPRPLQRMTSDASEIHKPLTPALNENTAMDLDLMGDFSSLQGSPYYSEFDWPVKQTETPSQPWPAQENPFNKDSNQFAAFQTAATADPSAVLAGNDGAPYLAKITIRQPSATIITNIMSLVMNHEGQAWLELERGGDQNAQAK